MDSQRPDAAPWPISKFWLIAAGLSLLVLLVYAQTFLDPGFDFVSADDPDYVTSNPNVKQGITRDSLRWALTTFHAYNWHPLTWISLQLDYQVFGLSSRGFHLTNVLLHLANTLILFGLLKRLTGALWCSAVVAAFFAIHPTHVESVAWVTERKDVLSTLFWLLTIAAYAWYAAHPSILRYFLVGLMLLLGLMAKPMLVTLPAVLLLLDYWPLRRWQLGTSVPTQFARASLARLIVEKIPLFLLVAASIPVTVRAQGEIVRTFAQFSALVRIQNALVACGRYIEMTFWPTNLAIFYPHPGDTIPTWRVASAGLLLAAVTGFALWEIRRRPYFIVGWLWFLGTLVPVIGLMQVGKHALADRYTYVPTIGLYIALVWGAADIVAQWRIRLEVPASLTAALLALCLILAMIQVRTWRNSESLWRHAVEVTQDNPVAHEYLGLALAKAGRLPEAEEQFRASLRIIPGAPLIRGNLALTLHGQGRLDEAAREFEIAIQLQPELTRARLGLGRVRLQQGKPDEALRLFESALRLEPHSIEAQLAISQVHEEQGELDKAEKPLRAALESVPQSSVVHSHLARVLHRQGKSAEAIEHYDFALRLNPNSAELYNRKGIVLEGLGKLTEAVDCYQRAVELAPDDVLSRRNFAYGLYETGQTATAISQYRLSIRLDPDWPRLALEEAWNQATLPDARMRDGAQALRTAKQVCQLANWQNPQSLDVLAAAHAELGQFAEALKRSREALSLASLNSSPDQIRELRERARLYEDKKPFRQAAGTAPPNQ